MHLDRRRFVAVLGAVTTGGIAGCMGDGSDDGGDEGTGGGDGDGGTNGNQSDGGDGTADGNQSTGGDGSGDGDDDDGGGGGAQLATVVIRNNSYDPNELRVEPGKIVAWVNQDDHPHTVTSDSGNWDMDERVEGDSGATSYTFDEPGVYRVRCTIHPEMSMTVRVGD